MLPLSLTKGLNTNSPFFSYLQTIDHFVYIEYEHIRVFKEPSFMFDKYGHQILTFLVHRPRSFPSF